MARKFEQFLLKWAITLKQCAVTARCHCLLLGVGIIEVGRDMAVNDETHVHFPARKYVVTCATSASNFAKIKMFS
jgi:hypothetical protein